MTTKETFTTPRTVAIELDLLTLKRIGEFVKRHDNEFDMRPDIHEINSELWKKYGLGPIA